MHNHSNKNGGNKGMKWMMIICLLLLGALFLGEGKFFSTGYIWPILIGVFVVAHVWMMFKGHEGREGHSDADKEEGSVAAPGKQPDLKKEHK